MIQEKPEFMKDDINEGMVKKGGISNRPIGQRPEPPKGQGGNYIELIKSMREDLDCIVLCTHCDLGPLFELKKEWDEKIDKLVCKEGCYVSD